MLTGVRCPAAGIYSAKYQSTLGRQELGSLRPMGKDKSNL